MNGKTIRRTGALLGGAWALSALTGCGEEKTPLGQKADPSQIFAAKDRATAALPDPKAAPANPDPKKSATAPVSIPTEAEVGIPYYPGATPDDLANVTLQALRTADRVAVMLETPDPIDKVAAFYAQKLPKAEKTDSSASGRRVISYEQFVPGQAGLSVDLRDREGKTQIELASIRAAAPLPDPEPTAPNGTAGGTVPAPVSGATAPPPSNGTPAAGQPATAPPAARPPATNR